MNLTEYVHWRVNKYTCHLFIFRPHVNIWDSSSGEHFYSDDLCEYRKFALIERSSTQVDITVETHRHDEDIPLNGYYAIVNGNIESGEFNKKKRATPNARFRN